jgi:NIPSNAP
MKNRKWIVGGIAMLAFLAGSLITVHITKADQVSADNQRVFEILVYHAVPGKVLALASRFREASKLQAKHHLEAVGYWVPDDNPDWANTFIYIIAHRSLDDAKKNWAAFHADPEFQRYLKSEQAEPLIEKVDETYMRATEFSRAQ